MRPGIMSFKHPGSAAIFWIRSTQPCKTLGCTRSDGRLFGSIYAVVSSTGFLMPFCTVLTLRKSSYKQSCICIGARTTG